MFVADDFQIEAINDINPTNNDKPKRKASTIAITSGKGGVGKTTISLKYKN